MCIRDRGETEVPYYQLKLGELAVLTAAYAPASVTVANLASTTNLGAEKSDVRLTWDYTYHDDFDHFDIYKKYENGERTLVCLLYTSNWQFHHGDAGNFSCHFPCT